MPISRFTTGGLVWGIVVGLVLILLVGCNTDKEIEDDTEDSSLVWSEGHWDQAEWQ